MEQLPRLRPVGGAGPGEGHAVERRIRGLCEVRLEVLQRPAPAELPPRLQGGVLHPPAFQPADRPLGGTAVARRVGQPGTVGIAQVEQMVHHLGSRERLLLDAVHDLQVHILGNDRATGEERGQAGEQGGAMHEASLMNGISGPGLRRRPPVYGRPPLAESSMDSILGPLLMRGQPGACSGNSRNGRPAPFPLERYDRLTMAELQARCREGAWS